MSKNLRQDDIRQLQASPAAFRNALLVETDAGPRRFGEILDPWQRADFEVLDPSWQCVAGYDAEPRFMRSLWERGRGHSKTSDFAASVSYALFASQRKIDGVSVAADKDQAALLRNAVERLLRLNPWLAQCVEAQRDRIINRFTGSTLTIMPSDVASSWGLLVDFIAMDEFSVWPRREMFDSLLSTAAKKKNCLLTIISNAGSRDHWSWDIREAIASDPSWHFSRQEGPVASWLSPRHIEEQKRLLLPSQFRRCVLNEWVDGSGDSLSAADIDACCTLTRPQGRRHDRFYLASLDLGIRHDHSALTMFAVDPIEQLIEVPLVYSWKPNDFGGCIDLTIVREEILRICHHFQCTFLIYDFWQAELLATDLTEQGVITHPWTFSPTNRDMMARSLIEVLRSRQLAMYPDPDLIADLKKMRVKEQAHLGLRLDAPRDAARGHCDRGCALAQGLPIALEIAQHGAEILCESTGDDIAERFIAF